MAFLRCDYHSTLLDMSTSFIASLPDSVDLDKAPVLYLLHGLSDNCTGWSRYTRVDRYAYDHQVAVIMPEVQRSFYTDMAMGMEYFSYITEELPAFCRHAFGLSRERELNYVAGLSMGGYGALKCALKRPESYAACAAFSSVTDYPGRAARADERERREIRAIVGPDGIVPEDEDLFALLKKADASALPEFYMTCGEQDALYGENVRFARALEEKGARLRFDHWEGTHSWELWDRSIKQTMELFFGNRR